MILLLTFAAICILSGWLASVADDSYKYENWTPILGGIAVITAIITLGMLIAIPISRNDTARGIQVMEATRQTVKNARKDTIDPLERATLTKEVIDRNAWLAQQQYDNEHLFDIYVVDEIMDVKPIE